MPSEAMLEEFLERDPSLLGDPLLVIGRQVRTPHGKFIDLLAIDGDGNLHVLELKRDRSPRDVVAQVLDYGSWVSTLDRESVLRLANDKLDSSFESAFDRTFGYPAPDEINEDVRLTIVATALDDSSERIVGYLRNFGVPVNAVFFSYLEDEDRRYLARSWLVSDTEPGVEARRGGSKRRTRAVWNGVDWYVNFGTDEPARSWEDGRKYNFVSAGGGRWYSQTLKNLPVGARVNVYLPQRGYVAVGETLAKAERFDQAHVQVDGEWHLLSQQDLSASYEHTHDGADSDDVAEYVVPVRWIRADPLEGAYREPGMFASTHSACQLKQEFTLKKLAKHFRIDTITT